MKSLLEILREHRQQILHYLLVGATFLACYFLFGYLNLTGGYGGGYGYGCYDFAPLQPTPQATVLPASQETQAAPDPGAQPRERQTKTSPNGNGASS